MRFDTPEEPIAALLMLPADSALDPDLEAALAALDLPREGGAFDLPGNLVHFHRAKKRDKVRTRGIRSLIKPENARALVDALPLGPDDRTHVVLRGDFVLCDLIPAIIERHGPCPSLYIATLGLSAANAGELSRLREEGKVGALTILCSHYFRGVDKTTTYREVVSKLEGCARLIVSRNHCKVIALPTASGHSFIIEGSANLRSSANIEQIVITNDPETLAFHRGWMDTIAAEHGTGT